MRSISPPLLAESYWVRLADPIELSQTKVEALAACIRVGIDDWNYFVASLRSDRDTGHKQHRTQLHLV